MDIWGVEKDYSEQLSVLPYKKKEDKQGFQEEKNHNKIHFTKKENSDRACDRSPEIVLDNELHIQKQHEKVR